MDRSGDTETSEMEAKDQCLFQDKRQEQHQRKVEDPAKTSKMMDLQYFSELIDQKYRL